MEGIGKTYTLYGYPAHPISKVLEASFRRIRGPPAEDHVGFNTNMSSCRICVEWAFGKIVQQCAFVLPKEPESVVATCRQILRRSGHYYKLSYNFVRKSNWATSWAESTWFGRIFGKLTNLMYTLMHSRIGILSVAPRFSFSRSPLVLFGILTNLHGDSHGSNGFCFPQKPHLFIENCTVTIT